VVSRKGEKRHMPPCQNSWKRKDAGGPEDKCKVKNTEEDGIKVATQESDPTKAKWEGNQKKQEDVQNTWGTKGSGTSSAVHQDEGKTHHAPTRCRIVALNTNSL
jgi:hypothetical protein